MRTPIRRRVGAVIVLVSALFAIGLYVYGTPLLSSKSADTPQSENATLGFTINVASTSGTGMTVLVYWPLIIVGLFATIGAVTTAWPQRKPPRVHAPGAEHSHSPR